MDKLLLVALLCCALVAAMAKEKVASSDLEVDCPICMRVMRSVKDLAKGPPAMKGGKALEKYCSLGESLEISDEKFCYDIDSMRSTLNRLLEFGATEERLCKRIKDTNPDFCSKKATNRMKSVNSDGDPSNVRLNKGVIFE